MKKILLVCSGGMSSAIVVKSIEGEAAKSNLDLIVKAIGSGEYEDEVGNGWDIVLVAPQIRHRMKVFEGRAKELNIPISVMAPMEYSPMGGKKLIEKIRNMF
ncbi:MAG: PTS sugar transporter subunit IIB [Clostridia bacterium]|nr:PTS sugar transporter subunit IIB [Clostridia bacterium]